jgi:hypothetical protein
MVLICRLPKVFLQDLRISLEELFCLLCLWGRTNQKCPLTERFSLVTIPNRPLEGGAYWISDGLFISLCESILGHLARNKFKVVVAAGHGPSQSLWDRYSKKWQSHFGLTVVSIGDDLEGGWVAQKDHAGLNETSLMMALHPGGVAIDRITTNNLQGVSGEFPGNASKAYGEQLIEQSMASLKKY